MTLRTLSEAALVQNTRTALQRSREAELEVLRHFQEIERRRLWVHAGSLNKFLQRTFQLTDDQIYPRLKAMQLMTQLPEVEQKIEAGTLSVTNLFKAQQTFSTESRGRAISLEEKREVLESLEKSSTRAADRILAEKYPLARKPPEKIKPVAINQNLIQFYVNDETLKQIEELKAKYSHQMPSGKMEELIRILMRLEKRQPKPKKQAAPRKRSRHIPAAVRREMEKSRQEGCEYQDPLSGKRCESKHFLQLDHVQEYSRGGSNEAHNLRWLCGFHNRHRGETGRSAPFEAEENLIQVQ